MRFTTHTGPAVSPSGLVPHVPRTPRAARWAPYKCSYGDILFPNSINSFVPLHFSCPRSGIVPGADRFNAGYPGTINVPSNAPRFGGLQNTDRISHAEFRGAGAVSEITSPRSESSPLSSVTRLPSGSVRVPFSHVHSSMPCHVICTPLTF